MNLSREPQVAKLLICSVDVATEGLVADITEDGLPVGFMMTAAYGNEDLWFSVAAERERAFFWAKRKPLLWT